jgi:hypothetical protein
MDGRFPAMDGDRVPGSFTGAADRRTADGRRTVAGGLWIATGLRADGRGLDSEAESWQRMRRPPSGARSERGQQPRRGHQVPKRRFSGSDAGGSDASESGFGESGFGESGFGESGFGESGFGESGAR